MPIKHTLYGQRYVDTTVLLFLIDRATVTTVGGVNVQSIPQSYVLVEDGATVFVITEPANPSTHIKASFEQKKRIFLDTIYI